MACSVNFSNNADTRNPRLARHFAVDPHSRAVTLVVKAVGGKDARGLVCLCMLLPHHLRLPVALILPQTGCLRGYEGAALLHLLRRDDRVDSSIKPITPCDSSKYYRVDSRPTCMQSQLLSTLVETTHSQINAFNFKSKRDSC